MDGDRIHGWLQSLVDSVDLLVEENPRVGWIKAWEKGTGNLK